MLTVLQTSPHLNKTVLQRTVEHLPKLRGLHVIGCLRVTHVDVLSATEYIPHLQSLAFTVMETVSTLFFPIVGRSMVGVFFGLSIHLVKRSRTLFLVTHAVLYLRVASRSHTRAGSRATPYSGRGASHPVYPVSPDPTRARSILALFIPLTSDPLYRTSLLIFHGPRWQLSNTLRLSWCLVDYRLTQRERLCQTH
jgi:hypothetical protein